MMNTESVEGGANKYCMSDIHPNSRILELAGILAEARAMTMGDAGNILRKVGIDTRNPDDSLVQKAMKANPKVAAVIAAAYKLFRSPQDPHSPAVTAPAQAPRENEPMIWARGLADPTIRTEDFSDSNFVRKYIWEISGKPKSSPLTLWAFDGHKFTNSLVVYGLPKFHKEMAKAMLKLYGARNPTAILLSAKGSNKVGVICLDGRIFNQPIILTHQTDNPATDWAFIGELPRILSGITRKFEDQTDEKAEDYKAWINVEDNRVIAFDAGKSYYDAIRDDPSTFHAQGAASVLHARIAAERAGWCAVGINTGEDGKVGAIVTAMTPKQALKAARLLFHNRWAEGDWNLMKIKTNDESITLNSRVEMKEYLKSGKNPQKDDSNTTYL
jgi:hypothetical protein